MAPTISRTRTTGYVTVKGLEEAMRALGVFTTPTVFAKLVEAELTAAAKTVIVPAIQQAAPKGPAPHRSAMRGKRGRRGPLSKTVTVITNKRKYRRNNTEVGAVNVGPRAWYRHFVIQGTRPHGLLRGAKLRTGSLQDESKRRNWFHPGATPNDFVGRAVKGKDAALQGALGNAPMNEYKRRLGKRITL